MKYAVKVQGGCKLYINKADFTGRLYTYIRLKFEVSCFYFTSIIFFTSEYSPDSSL